MYNICSIFLLLGKRKSNQMHTHTHTHTHVNYLCPEYVVVPKPAPVGSPALGGDVKVYITGYKPTELVSRYGLSG